MRSKDSPSGQTFTERARRAQLLSAACDLIAEIGYPNTSIARIAERIGVAKGVVLYHFKTKDALVAAIVEDVMIAGATTMIPAMMAHETATGKLHAYIRSNCEFIHENRVRAVAMFEIVSMYRTPEGLRFDQAVAAQASTTPPPPEMAMLDPKSVFELGIETGEFDPDRSPLRLRNALRAALDGAVSELARDHDYDVRAYGEELVEIFTRAVRRPP
ncbi:TetR/AcrR family transcriptional regulator [Smaragdicoccus niigatensis]|uniref:TetR/AcrR family transcriptional regulator n=1 Tax=Smaragdicoccus niigatensis TaxID=359359 RepID=UPI00047630A7|nr:TetR/AcrR family transcriptional regulator [Smaragdicoccus niigatensis]